MNGIGWTEKDIQILRDMHQSTETPQLAILLNRSNQSVRCKLHKLGLLRDKKTYRLSEEDIQNLNGLTINKIAERLDVSQRQARTYIKHNNIRCSIIKWTPEDDKMLVDNYQDMFLQELHETFFPHISFKALKAHKETLELVKEDRGRLLIGYKIGEDSPNWRGGVSFEPYCYKFNDVLKEKIRDAFDRKCVVCGISESECMSDMQKAGKRPCKLHVHHIGSDKTQGCNGTEFNLVPLCASCHTRIHWHPEIERGLVYKHKE